MPALVMVGAAPPAVIPDPGVENLTKLERGFLAGTAREPDYDLDYVRFPYRVVETIPTVPPVEDEMPGWPRPSMHPHMAYDLRSPLAPDAWQDNPKGQRVQFGPPLAKVAPGAQQPMPGPQGNTWRAEPKPWDAAFYVGAYPATA